MRFFGFTLIAIALSLLAWRQFTPKPRPSTPATQFPTIVESLNHQRQWLKSEFLRVQKAESKAALIEQGRSLFLSEFPIILNSWLGTPYDFNGHAANPGKTPVACGHFVSSVMQNAGCQLNRLQLGQLPSQQIISTFIPSNKLTVNSGQPYKAFLNEIYAQGDGVFLVGLDTHIVFLTVLDGKMRCIHASRSSSKQVVSEGPKEASTLKRSQYRVYGKLDSDYQFLKKWILGEPFEISR